MTFYELLKAKALDSKYKDKFVWMGQLVQEETTFNYAAVTYEELLTLVDSYIDKYKNYGSKKAYIIVDNSINSIAAIIAFLKLGLTPILIDYKNLEVEIDADIKLPYIYTKGASDDGMRFHNKVNMYVDSIDQSFSFNENELNGGNIIIGSSGSEGFKPHLEIIKESDLMSLPNQYGETGSRFYSYISCANISGILTNLVNPIINDCVVMMSDSFDLECFYFNNDVDAIVNSDDDRFYDSEDYIFSYRDFEFIKYIMGDYKKEDKLEDECGKIRVHRRKKGTYDLKISEDFQKYNIDTMPDTIMFPRNIVEYLKKIDLTRIDLSLLKRVYLAGGINTQEDINNIGQLVRNLPAGIITNLYGSTEANGVICSCSEFNLKTCYINITRYKEGIITYSFDRKNVYQIKNGVVTHVDDEFRLYTFAPYLSVSEGIVDNIITDCIEVKLRKNGSNEFVKTGDLGIYIEGQLYIIGRESDIYFDELGAQNMKHIEHFYSRVMRVPTYFVKDPSGKGVQVYLHYDKDDYSQWFDLYDRAQKFRNLYKPVNITSIVVLNNHVFPMSKISGKVSMPKLRSFGRYAKIHEENYYSNHFESMVKMTKQFIEKYFKNYEVTDIDEDFYFTLKLSKDDFFFPFYASFNQLFDLERLDEENGTIKLIPNFQTLFYVDEDFNEGEAEKIAEDTMVLQGIKEIYNEYQSIIANFKYVPVDINKDIDIESLKQLVMNFWVKFKEYLETHEISDNPEENACFIPAVKMKQSLREYQKMLKR